MNGVTQRCFQFGNGFLDVTVWVVPGVADAHFDLCGERHFVCVCGDMDVMYVCEMELIQRNSTIVEREYE